MQREGERIGGGLGDLRIGPGVVDWLGFRDSFFYSTLVMLISRENCDEFVHHVILKSHLLGR